MRQFPLAAKVYIWAVIVSGVPAFLYAYSWGTNLSSWRLLLALWISSAVATYWKVPLFNMTKTGENNSGMSLGFVPTFLTLLCFGPLAGLVAGTISCLTSALYPRRAAYYQALFNISTIALSVLAAGMILRPVGLATGALQHGSMADAQYWEMLGHQIPIIFLATLVYYLINSGFVAAAIALSTGRNPFKVWRGHFLWTGPGYFVGASCATIILALGRSDALQNSERWGVLVLIAGPILFLTYYSYKIYMDKAHANEQHIQELERGKEELQQLYNSTVESLAHAIEAKDRYTNEHILRVQKIADAIAGELGLSDEELQGIHTGALLHDIGKLGIPEHILVKPGKLTDDEFEKIKAHPAIGSRILEPVRFPWPVMGAVRSHHERWDGRGYPDALKGEEIPIGGRILAVADVYDALTSDRSYREGWPHQRACDHIRAQAGTHFDPAVVEAFLRVMEANRSLRNDTSAQKAPPVPAKVRGGVAHGISRASFEYVSLYEISQTVSVTLDLQETLSLLANKINKIFGSTTCVLLLADGDTLRAEMAVGHNEPFFLHAQTRIGDGITGGVAASGEGVVGPYDRSDLLLTSARTPWAPLESALIAPLLSEGKVIGTVNLYGEKAHAFDAEDLRVLLAVSAQAGRAIQNARVFERTRESALTDALTGLHNGRYLALFLEQELHRALREQRPLSVLVMDLDNFKPINDTFGHARGDQVLRDLAAIFSGTLRGGDLVARYAGDEFVAVLPHANAAQAKVVAEKIRAAVAGYNTGGSDLGGICVGVSVGTASFPSDATDAATLIACADAAMYRDKSRRKGRPISPGDAGSGSVGAERRLVA